MTAIRHNAPTSADAPRRGVGDVAPGLLVALLVAAVATVLGQFVPVVGGPVFGILLGALAAGVVPALRGTRTSAGYAVASKAVLQLSIVVLGTGLSLSQVVRVGGQSLPV
ncbi:MAG TPA: putative sulfate exporter family transporter, partial [Pseudonocardiaceae bacterium]